mgnify:CR=1 FL=1
MFPFRNMSGRNTDGGLQECGEGDSPIRRPLAEYLAEGGDVEAVEVRHLDYPILRTQLKRGLRLYSKRFLSLGKLV